MVLGFIAPVLNYLHIVSWNVCTKLITTFYYTNVLCLSPCSHEMKYKRFLLRGMQRVREIFNLTNLRMKAYLRRYFSSRIEKSDHDPVSVLLVLIKGILKLLWTLDGMQWESPGILIWANRLIDILERSIERKDLSSIGST